MNRKVKYVIVDDSLAERIDKRKEIEEKRSILSFGCSSKTK